MGYIVVLIKARGTLAKFPSVTPTEKDDDDVYDDDKYVNGDDYYYDDSYDDGEDCHNDDYFDGDAPTPLCTLQLS